jgi:bacteriocin-like protein
MVSSYIIYKHIKNEKMKKVELNKFQKLSNEELKKIEGGWKLFGHEDTPVEGSNCWSEADGCCQNYIRKTYFFGIVVNEQPIGGGCSYFIGNSPQCQTCTMC